MNPQCKLLFHSNHRWLSEDLSSGFKRRLLYIEITRIARKQDPQLFDKLKENVDGLFHWAIHTPVHLRKLGDAVEAINSSMGSLEENFFREWVLTDLRPNPQNKEILGASKIRPDGLYLMYCQFCATYEQIRLSPQSFSKVLLDTLRSLGCNASKIKKRKGYFILGVMKYDENETNHFEFTRQSNKLINKLNEFDPLKGWIEENLELGVKDVLTRIIAE